MNEFHYFQTAVYREERPEWVEPVLRRSEPYYEAQRKRHKEENIGWPVIQTEHMGNDPELQFLGEFFGQTATGILESQGYYLEPYELRVNGMWGQEIGQGGMHEPHVHASTQMCGFFFLQTPEWGAYPIFSDPRPGKLMTDCWTKQDGNVHLASPQIHFNNVIPGTFMFFNAWVPHQFTINQNQEPTKLFHFLLSAREKAN